MVAMITIASIVYTTANSILSSQSSYTSFAQTQTNNTQQQQQLQSKNNDTNKNYEKFHANIEQIIGHIKMAEFNKNINNNTLAYNHTSHPIEEVLSLVTIPISNVDKKLNDTYFKELYALSAQVNPSSTSTTKEAFNKQAQNSIDFSNNIIKTVIPLKTLNTTNHNIKVIQNLLNTSKEEYEEGVKDGKIVSMLEYQDGTAFMDRAYFLFNNTKSIAANGDRQMISKLFSNLTHSTLQQKNPEEINKIIDEINKKLAEGSTSSSSTTNTNTTNQTMTNPSSSSSIPITNANATNTNNVNSSSLSYISKIRSLLDQVVSTYTANDTAKAKELATTAYLDNFENIEKPIGKELSDAGEQLLRVQLRDQISNKVSLDEIKQTISEANTVLDKAENILK
jgi:3-dehydroquinate dehydratase/ribosomal protein L29